LQNYACFMKQKICDILFYILSQTQNLAKQDFYFALFRFHFVEISLETLAADHVRTRRTENSVPHTVWSVARMETEHSFYRGCVKKTVCMF
jgi:hypothetical protein